mmetsp:Transcript_21371/g.52673  ORF Transcript_21371/g.52673 Transcript_21371/m.52673 type:complete len:263 (-) Transcript_21371:885-1673(-)
MVRAVSSTRALTSKDVQSSTILPFSMRAMSRMLFTSPRRVSEAIAICSQNCHCSTEMSISITRLFMPRMTLRGVRISWLIVAKNSLFASFAICTRHSSASCSITFRKDEMSCAIAMHPTMRSYSFLRGVTFRRRSTRVWSAAMRGNSKLRHSIPCIASRNTACTDSRQPTATHCSANTRPRICSFGILVSCAIMRFHSVMRSLSSTQKMGALAVSMSFLSSCTTASRSCCMILERVMSCPTHTTPRISMPLSSLCDVALHSR